MAEISTTFDADSIGGDDVQAYIDVVLGAFAIHADREAIRHGLWKEYPARDQMFHVGIKADRVRRTLDDTLAGQGASEGEIAAMVAEARDIINYTIFTVRILESGKYTLVP